MLKDLTIIIITYKRYEYLKRLLEFYLNFDLEYKILILDSTPYDHNDEKLKTYFSLPSVMHKQFDEKIFFVEKIKLGCKFINTKYSVLCADDDFLVPSGLIKCRDFLKRNFDYSCAHGYYYQHYKNKNEISFSKLYSNSTSAEQNDPIDRVKFYTTNKMGSYTFYALYRTNTFNKIWDETSKYVHDHLISEIFPCCLSLIFGKVKYLRVFYSSREANLYSWWSDKRVKEITNDDKMNKCINGISSNLIEQNLSANNKNINLQVTEIINEKREQFINLYNKKKLNKKRITLVRRIINFLQRIYVKLMYSGCPKEIYFTSYKEYLLLKKLILSSGANQLQLNESRKENN